MQDRIREYQNHAGQNKGEPEACRAEKRRTRTMQDKIRENQNLAVQVKGETVPSKLNLVVSGKTF